VTAGPAAGRDGRRRRVVVVGGGFGGLRVARGLRDADVDVVMVDRVNHHLFQPLLYQVATGLLPPGDIAPPLRRVLRRQRNARVVLGEVTDVDPRRRCVRVAAADGGSTSLDYDVLVLAAGATTTYFGHPQWAEGAPGMKSLGQAVELRERLLHAFEAAAVAGDAAARRPWLTFLVVGAGPTGVELAGQLAALARRSLRGQFRGLDTADLRIVVVDAGEHVLGPFPEPLRRHARDRLERLGVEIVLGHAATAVDDDGITIAPSGGGDGSDGGGERQIEARTVVWAAGVEPVALTARLAEATGAETDHKGRIRVRPDCTLPGHDEIFAIGDLANLHDLPGIAEPALQEGRYVADLIRHRLGERPDPGDFRYRDLGTMATISPFDAVADVGTLRLRGLPAKVAWAGVHLTFLTGWGNRAAVLAAWAWTLTTRSRRQQVILGPAGSPEPARRA
jgi:NADH dehydrogenase